MLGGQVDAAQGTAVGEQEFLDRHPFCREGSGERREPLGVLVDDVHARSCHRATLGTLPLGVPGV